MTRTEYLAELDKYLKRLPEVDYQEAMDYFVEYFEEAGLKVYSCMKSSLSIDEIYRELLSSSCKEVTKENCSTLLDSGSSSCTCSSK